MNFVTFIIKFVQIVLSNMNFKLKTKDNRNLNLVKSLSHSELSC